MANKAWTTTAGWISDINEFPSVFCDGFTFFDFPLILGSAFTNYFID